MAGVQMAVIADHELQRFERVAQCGLDLGAADACDCRRVAAANHGRGPGADSGSGFMCRLR